ncbi:Uncharacterized protein Fot_51396 [Forsythia ovata]|uniref:Uncharacterized protein n=1 Tax=Forsythia ovata TaxID=205694 RepID=A0ABD1PVA3_9LAMI
MEKYFKRLCKSHPSLSQQTIDETNIRNDDENVREEIDMGSEDDSDEMNDIDILNDNDDIEEINVGDDCDEMNDINVGEDRCNPIHSLSIGKSNPFQKYKTSLSRLETGLWVDTGNSDQAEVYRQAVLGLSRTNYALPD